MVVLNLEEGLDSFHTDSDIAEGLIGDPEEFFDTDSMAADKLNDKADEVDLENNLSLLEEKDAAKGLADVVNRKFLNKAGKADDKPKNEIKKSRPAAYKGDLPPELHANYNPMDELFSYLGKLKTATNIYREHFIEYAEKKKDDSAVPSQAKTQDMKYDEFEEMIRVKKVNNIMSGGRSGGLDGGNSGFESASASTQEKWEVLKLFAHYKILAMLRYTFSMT